MDALQDRVAAQLAQEGRRLRSEQMRVCKRLRAVERTVMQRMKATEAALATLAAGERLTVAQRHMLADMRRSERLVLEAQRLGARRDQIARRLARLERPGEISRRVREARQLGGGDEPLTSVDAAEAVLVRNGKAMHVDDITAEALQTGIVRFNGKTPKQTISSHLARLSSRGERFVRVAPNTYDVRPAAPVGSGEHLT